MRIFLAPAASSGCQLSSISEADGHGVFSRKEFVQYIFSLLRGHTSEHGDEVPLLELNNYRHIAYCLDGLLYYLGMMDSSAANQKHLLDLKMDYADAACGGYWSSAVRMSFDSYYLPGFGQNPF